MQRRIIRYRDRKKKRRIRACDPPQRLLLFPSWLPLSSLARSSSSRSNWNGNRKTEERQKRGKFIWSCSGNRAVENRSRQIQRLLEINRYGDRWVMTPLHRFGFHVDGRRRGVAETKGIIKLRICPWCRRWFDMMWRIVVIISRLGSNGPVHKKLKTFLEHK